MVAIAVGTVAVNAMNDYTGSLSLQAAGFRIKRVYSAVIVAVLGFLFTLYLNAQADFATSFVNFLLFISYWIAPFVGVVLADWWLRRRHADVSRLSDFGGLPSGVVGIAALIIGFLVGIPFQNSSLGYDLGRAVQLRHRELPPRRGHRLLRGRDRGRGHLHHLCAEVGPGPGLRRPSHCPSLTIVRGTHGSASSRHVPCVPRTATTSDRRDLAQFGPIPCSARTLSFFATRIGASRARIDRPIYPAGVQPADER